jgi:glutathione synthase
MKIAFIMEPMAEVNVAESGSYALIQAAYERGHTIYNTQANDIAWNGNKLYASARKIHTQQFNFTEEPAEIIDLTAMDVVKIRQDPPFDMRYITLTYMLEALPKHVRAINPPQAIRNLGEKITPLLFPEITPKTMITESIEALIDFRKQHQHIILKPLYLYGGQGVKKISHDDELASYAKELIISSQAPIIAQEFLSDVDKGDKRIILYYGEMVACYARVPISGSYLANTAQGGSIEAKEATPRDKEIVATLSPWLKHHHIGICGIDVIGDYLTEINVTCPAGQRHAEILYGKSIAHDFWHIIEQQTPC